MDENRKKAHLNYAKQFKRRVLHSEPEFRTLKSLSFLEDSYYAYWNEESGEHIDRFRKILSEQSIPYSRKDQLRNIPLRKKIKNL